MSFALAQLRAADKRKNLTRTEILALMPDLEYLDGRTKQAFKDEADIVKIMARADRAGTISHLEKYEGVYADYSDYDFQNQTMRLAQGQTIFDELPAEMRREFNQSPQEFFAYVNDPKNVDDLSVRLPGLAAPGTQRISALPADADTEKAEKATSEPVASVKKEEGEASPELKKVLQDATEAFNASKKAD